MNQQPFVLFQDVCKYYQMGDTRIAAADHVSFSIERGEFCVILGPSGAGKTTVLNMLGGMDTCDEGTIVLDGQVVSRFNAKELTRYRRYDVGFVFQFYNLVQNLTARENVELASEICRDPLDADLVLKKSGWPTGVTISRPSFRAGNSSGCRSPAPWPKTLKFCSVMNRLARLITKPASRCWRCCRQPAAKKAAP